MKTYKDAIKKSMNFLAQDPKTLFIGYGVKTGSKGGGFFSEINESQLIETPVAEGLMLSLAIGLSIEGYKPVVFYERFDFIMNAMDALVNHLDKMKTISKAEYAPKAIIRCVIGGKSNPFFTGVTHTQDHTEAMRKLVSFPVLKPTSKEEMLEAYIEAYNSDKSYMIIEEKDWYAKTI
jgi:pyruvate/2-oxoglutarate/acetoin dehydrogenase E1 component